MQTEEEAITQLLDSNASASQQKAALKWMGEYLEETHILNLAPPKAVLNALDKFSKGKNAEAALQTKARGLIKKYDR